MRILSLTWGFSFGGVGKCLLTYNRLNEYSGLQVHTACISLQKNDNDLAPLHAIGATIVQIRNRRDLSWLARVVGLIEEFKPDILFVHGFNGPVVAKVLEWKIKRKLPFVCSYHGKYHAPTKVKKLVEPVYNFVQEQIYRKHTNTIVVCADYCKRHLIAKNVDRDKLAVVHNGISVQRNSIAPVLREDLGIPVSAVVFGVASRLDPIKGIKYLMDAFKYLVERHPEAMLVLVGDGTIRDDLKAFAKNEGLADRTRFVGYRSNVDDWLDLFDVFMLPSSAEYHSIALLEAMRAGKAIIATDVGGNTESVRDRQEALIVPPADSKALETAMLEMIRNRELRISLASAAMNRFLTEFTEDRMLEKLAAWFREMGICGQADTTTSGSCRTTKYK